MDRVIKWNYLISGAFVGVLIVHSLVTNPVEIVLLYNSTPNLVSAVIMIATGGVCMLMVGRLLPILWKKKKEPLLVEILISIFLFLGLTILFQGVFSLIHLTPRQLNLAMMQSIFFFLAAAGVFLAQFWFEVFGGGRKEKGNRAWFIVVTCVAVALDLEIVKDTIIGSEMWELEVVGAPAVFAFLYLVVKLAYSALTTVHKIEDPVVKRSYRLMGAGWGILLFGFFFLIFGGFFDIELLIDQLLYIILSATTFGVIFTGATLLYIGFTLPMKTNTRS